MQSAALLVRRKQVEQGLLLMMTRNLVHREVGSDGIKYSAGENATIFLTSLASTYLVDLKERANWLAKSFGSCTDDDFKRMMRRFFDDWVEEFQYVEHSLGAQS